MNPEVRRPRTSWSAHSPRCAAHWERPRCHSAAGRECWAFSSHSPRALSLATRASLTLADQPLGSPAWGKHLMRHALERETAVARERGTHTAPRSSHLRYSAHRSTSRAPASRTTPASLASALYPAPTSPLLRPQPLLVQLRVNEALRAIAAVPAEGKKGD